MRVFFVVLLLHLLVVTRSSNQLSSVVGLAFVANEIVPDVILDLPEEFMKVEYPNGRQVLLGNIIKPVEAIDQPNVSWHVDPFALYTLACVDPDAISRQNPILSEFKHWLVGNIPGDNISKGDVLASYFPPTPPAGSGLHRYVFLLYKQKGQIDFDEPRTLELTENLRIKFSISAFAKKYAMEGPVAGNFYFSQAATNSSLPPLSRKIIN